MKSVQIVSSFDGVDTPAGAWRVAREFYSFMRARGWQTPLRPIDLEPLAVAICDAGKRRAAGEKIDWIELVCSVLEKTHPRVNPVWDGSVA